MGSAIRLFLRSAVMLSAMASGAEGQLFAQQGANVAAVEVGSGTLQLRGLTGPAVVVKLADLKSMPQVTVTVHNPHSNADESYSGVLLVDLLAKVGAPRGKDLHGKALSDYLVATGSDEYKVVLALAEIDPDFHPGSVIVADQIDGKPLDAGNGPFKLIVSEDKRPARWVRDLVSVEVRSAQ